MQTCNAAIVAAFSSLKPGPSVNSLKKAALPDGTTDSSDVSKPMARQWVHNPKGAQGLGAGGAQQLLTASGNVQVGLRGIEAAKCAVVASPCVAANDGCGFGLFGRLRNSKQ